MPRTRSVSASNTGSCPAASCKRDDGSGDRVTAGTGFAGQRLVGDVSGAHQRLGVGESALLGQECFVFSGLRLRLSPISASPWRSSSSSRARSCWFSVRSVSRSSTERRRWWTGRYAASAVATASPPNASKAVSCSAERSSRNWSDWPCTATSSSVIVLSRRRRCGRSADEGPRPALSRHRAAQHDHAVVDRPASVVDQLGDASNRPGRPRSPRPAPARIPTEPGRSRLAPRGAIPAP